MFRNFRLRVDIKRIIILVLRGNIELFAIVVSRGKKDLLLVSFNMRDITLCIFFFERGDTAFFERIENSYCISCKRENRTFTSFSREGRYLFLRTSY